MIPSTHSVLVYRTGADKPDAVPWGNIYEDFKNDPDWLKQVEAALEQGDSWRSGETDGGANRQGIVRIEHSRMWHE